MGPTAACVDTMETIMKSWISPHLFGVRLTGLVVFECALGVGCMYVCGGEGRYSVSGRVHSVADTPSQSKHSLLIAVDQRELRFRRSRQKSQTD